MRLINIQQGTSEWHCLRQAHTGASDCAAIMGDGMFGNTARKVYFSKLPGAELLPETEAMKHGKDTEAEARAYFSQKYNIDWQPAVGISEEFPWMMASFDGWDGHTVLEIKCPNSRRAFDEIVSSGKPPKGYLWQVMHQLAVAEVPAATLGFYYKGSGKPETHEIGIAWDEDMIARLIEIERAFWHENVLAFKEPEMAPEDFVERLDQDWLDAEEQWYKLDQEAEDVMEKREQARQKLIDLSGGESCRGELVNVRRIAKIGNIDYEAIPTIAGMSKEDKNRFRKPLSYQYRLTLRS